MQQVVVIDFPPRITRHASLAALHFARFLRLIWECQHQNTASPIENMLWIGIGCQTFADISHFPGITGCQPLTQTFVSRRRSYGGTRACHGKAEAIGFFLKVVGEPDYIGLAELFYQCCTGRKARSSSLKFAKTFPLGRGSCQFIMPATIERPGLELVSISGIRHVGFVAHHERDFAARQVVHQAYL